MAAVPLSVPAQQRETGAPRRLAVFTSFPKGGALSADRSNKLRQGLAVLGWDVGRNILIEHYGGAASDDARTVAEEMVAAHPDLILAASTPALAAAARVSGTIPIVFAAVSDPVGQGFVKSFARPGGTITGFTNFEPEMGGKWVDLLKEVAPDVTRAAVIYNPTTAPNMNSFDRSMHTAAAARGITLVDTPVHEDNELEGSLKAAGNQPASGLVFPTDPFTNFREKRITEQVERYRLPAVYPFSTFVHVGGLISYGTDIAELYRQSAAYIDRILRGARPADLPVQLPTKFELAINLQTARSIGLTVSSVLLARADDIVE